MNKCINHTLSVRLILMMLLSACCFVICSCARSETRSERVIDSLIEQGVICNADGLRLAYLSDRNRENEYMYFCDNISILCDEDLGKEWIILHEEIESNKALLSIARHCIKKLNNEYDDIISIYWRKSVDEKADIYLIKTKSGEILYVKYM